MIRDTLGFAETGLELGPDEPCQWPRRPVVLPEGWDAIEVGQVYARGRPMRLIAEHGAERARLEPA